MYERFVASDAAIAMANAPPSAQIVEAEGRRVSLHESFRSDTVGAEKGNEKRERLDEIGRIAQESLSLAQVLVHQAKLLLLQVAEPAVNHL